MAIPTIKGITSNTGTDASSLTLTKPTGAGAPSTNDRLLLLVNNDNNGSGEGWNTLSGWTQVYNEGNTTSDNYIACYTRIADGTEGSSINVPLINLENSVGWYIVLDGADELIDIEVGSVAIRSVPALTISGFTTTNDDSLVFTHWGFDGADYGFFALDGVGWPVDSYAELAEDTGRGISSSGGFCLKNLATAGNTQSIVVDTPTGDGMIGIQFAVKGKEVSLTNGQIKYYSGSEFVSKPLKYWNGSSWTTKPLKYWNGSTWVTTTY